jgi:MFS family permease
MDASMARQIDQEAEGYPPFRTAVFALIGLMIACFFSFLDRQILNLLVQPIKHDLGVNDTQIGVLQGIAFALSYSLMALPFGWMVDRYHRFRLVCFGLAVWSLATLGLGFSRNFADMLVARVLIGAGEAALMPAAYSLLADYFPPRQRGRVFAVYMSSVLLGGAGALIVGGFVLRLLGDVETVWLPLIGSLPIWRAAFIVVSVPGLLLALPFLALMREPARKNYQPPGSKGAVSMTAYVRRHPQAFFTIFAAYSVLALVGYAVQSWSPTLLIRNYGVAPANAGLIVGVGLLLSGLVGAAIGGGLGDRWVQQGRKGGRLLLSLPFWILGFPALAVFGLAGDLRWAVAGFVLNGLVSGVMFVTSSAVVQDVVPGHLRGRAIALWYLITGILGNGLGPVIAGAVNDYLFKSEMALPLSILVIAGPGLLLGLLITLAGVAAYDRAREANRSGHQI